MCVVLDDSLTCCGSEVKDFEYRVVLSTNQAAIVAVKVGVSKTRQDKGVKIKGGSLITPN
jgi:hypothetical protein